MMDMSRGFVFVAHGRKYIEETMISVQAVRAHHAVPICLITTPGTDVDEAKFDIVIRSKEIEPVTFQAKIWALKLSPFERTVFLDSDTFVCTSVYELFNVLDLADIACTIEAKNHTGRSLPSYPIVFPEFNTGVIAFKNNQIVQKFADQWFLKCEELAQPIDMPAFREAVLVMPEVKILTLPDEYNLHGFASMLIIYGEAKILHERFGEVLKNTTPYLESYEKMRARVKKLNQKTYKRLYVPYFGIISYQWSPKNIIRKFKRIFGRPDSYRNISY